MRLKYKLFLLIDVYTVIKYTGIFLYFSEILERMRLSKHLSVNKHKF